MLIEFRKTEHFSAEFDTVRQKKEVKVYLQSTATLRTKKGGNVITNSEIKEALQNGKPVVVKIPRQEAMSFDCVHGITYRRNSIGGIIVSAELLDKNKNSVIVTEPKFVSYA